jgi:hypothetical protein
MSIVFCAGDTVIRRLHGFGIVTKDVATVLSSEDGEVWLDNGPGNRPSGPFIGGLGEGSFGFWEEIIPAPESSC